MCAIKSLSLRTSTPQGGLLSVGVRGSRFYNQLKAGDKRGQIRALLSSHSLQRRCNAVWRRDELAIRLHANNERHWSPSILARSMTYFLHSTAWQRHIEGRCVAVLGSAYCSILSCICIVFAYVAVCACMCCVTSALLSIVVGSAGLRQGLRRTPLLA